MVNCELCKISKFHLSSNPQNELKHDYVFPFRLSGFQKVLKLLELEYIHLGFFHLIEL